MYDEWFQDVDHIELLLSPYIDILYMHQCNDSLAFFGEYEVDARPDKTQLLASMWS